MRIARVLPFIAVVGVQACGQIRESANPSASSFADAAPHDAVSDLGGDARHCTFNGFAPAVVYPTANSPMSIVAVDGTSAGHLDLVVGEQQDVGGSTSEFFANAGDGTFTRTASYGAHSNNVGNMVSADFNGDGRVDLASQSNGTNGIDLGTDNGVLGVDFGTGNGMFASHLVPYSTPQTGGYLTVGDFNGDGHPDLAFAGYDYVESGGGASDGGLVSSPGPVPEDFALDVFFNEGDGTFAAPASYVNSQGFMLGLPSIASGDFDGDGHLDIAELTAGFGVFFNAGDGTFGREVTYVVDSGVAGLGVADFNGDGKDDIATTTTLNAGAANESYVLDVFSGADNRSFNGPAQYAIVNIPFVSQIVTGDFNGDGKPDLAMVLGPNDPNGGWIEPLPVAVFENRGDGTFGAPVTYHVGGELFEYATAIAAGDFNGDGVTDIAVTTSGETAPTPQAVNILLSRCE
jgi:hypothetical protein